MIARCTFRWRFRCESPAAWTARADRGPLCNECAAVVLGPKRRLTSEELRRAAAEDRERMEDR